MKEKILTRLEKISAKQWMLGTAVLYLLAVLPILLLGRYNVMCVDDYDYGAKVHDVWLATGSFWESVQAAWQQNMEFYQNWQGTYISCFLMGLCPMNFVYQSGWIVPVLMVGMLSISTFCLGKHVLVTWLGSEAKGAAGIMFLLLFLFYQVMEAPFEGIYWYNGATHYVLMESIFFLMLTALSASIHAETKGREIALCAVATLLAAIVGGGNLVTALQSEIMMAFLLIYVIVSARDRILPAIFPFIVGSIGFLFNTLAPGNTLRGSADQDVGYSAVASVLLSFYHAVVFIIRWTPAFVLLMWIALLPVLWKLMKKSQKRFEHPFLVTLGAYCVLSAMFTPTLYALGQVGLARIDDIIQMVYYLCLFAVTAYWLGYLSHRPAGCKDAAAAFGVFLERTRGGLTAVFLLAVLVMWVFTADKNTYTSISALRSLVYGEGETFYQEAMVRHEMYLDDEIQHVVVQPYTARPAVFGTTDLTDNPDNWLNRAVTVYYHKDEVRLDISGQ